MPSLRVGFVLIDQFTLAGFAGFIEALRLAADYGGRSRQISASWTIMSQDGSPCRASCGALIGDTTGLLDPANFDYIAVCGGNSYVRSADETQPLIDYLRKAASLNVRLVGICTGSFAIAKAGLIGRKTACINWNVFDLFRKKFPDIEARTDRLFIDQGSIITCAGSTAAIDLGMYLISRHCGDAKARQALRHMLLQDTRPSQLPQPHFYSDLTGVHDLRVLKAVHFMEQRLDDVPSVKMIADHVNVSVRQLERLFDESFDLSPRAFQLRLRLRYGRWLLQNSNVPIMEIAFTSGFSDAAHFSREFRILYGEKPSDARRARRTGSHPCPSAEDADVAAAAAKLDLKPLSHRHRPQHSL